MSEDCKVKGEDKPLDDLSRDGHASYWLFLFVGVIYHGITKIPREFWKYFLLLFILSNVIDMIKSLALKNKGMFLFEVITTVISIGLFWKFF